MPLPEPCARCRVLTRDLKRLRFPESPWLCSACLHHEIERRRREGPILRPGDPGTEQARGWAPVFIHPDGLSRPLLLPVFLSKPGDPLVFGCPQCRTEAPDPSLGAKACSQCGLLIAGGIRPGLFLEDPESAKSAMESIREMRRREQESG